eukprot:TRINITY_DN17330_c0_g1_i5.p1 TRINITY_DN17330_c0_g1~~TRINITY_DN17330_c0_g1_i5.p1  ORF type:complete len:802 (+),score=171.11 TRINITY_DN17330_c0_g1_i5:89-2494(+)
MEGEVEGLNWGRLLSLARSRGGYPTKRLSTRHSQLSRQASNTQSAGVCGFGEQGVRAIEALIALHRAMHSAPHLSSKLDVNVWISHRLTERMSTQIRDTLSMATNTLPDWFVIMPRVLPFMFPLEIRVNVFRSMAFGMSHSLWWMQEELIRQHFGPQLREARAAVDSAQQKNQENQVRLYRCSALLKYLVCVKEQNEAMASQQQIIDGTSTMNVTAPTEAPTAGLLAGLGFTNLKRLMSANGIDKNLMKSCDGKKALLLLWQQQDLASFMSEAGVQLPQAAPGETSPTPERLEEIRRAEQAIVEAHELIQTARSELERNFHDFTEKELAFSEKAVGRLRDQISESQAAMQQLAIQEGNAWEPVWQIEEQERAMRLGPKQLKSDTVVLDRENILEEAKRLMDQRTGTRNRLEIKWSGEQAFGQGVTQSFYTEVAKALQDRRHFKSMWGPEASDAKELTNFLVCPQGFFPRPTLECTQEVKNTFHMLGKVMATAVRDGFVVPLHISPFFFALVVGSKHDLASVGQMITAVRTLGSVGERYGALWSLCCRYPRPTTPQDVLSLGSVEFYEAFMKKEMQMSLTDFLDCMDDNDPLTNQPLWPQGDDRVGQLHDTIPRVCKLWLGDAVRDQVCAFRAGIDDVFGVDALSAFSMSELKDVLCGHEEVTWNEKELTKFLLPTGGYSRSSKHFKWICQILNGLHHPDRRRFLDFATAMPMLPPDGLSGLHLEISKPPHRKDASMFPTAMTCVPKLFLPEYESIDEMKLRLHEALGGFFGFDDRVGNAQAFEGDINIPEQNINIEASYSS